LTLRSKRIEEEPEIQASLEARLVRATEQLRPDRAEALEKAADADGHIMRLQSSSKWKIVYLVINEVLIRKLEGR
jgi:hypothetical protein